MTKTYEVIGNRFVHGYARGERFQADLTDGQELALIEGGHIGVVPEPAARQQPPAPAEKPSRKGGAKQDDTLASEGPDGAADSGGDTKPDESGTSQESE